MELFFECVASALTLLTRTSASSPGPAKWGGTSFIAADLGGSDTVEEGGGFPDVPRDAFDFRRGCPRDPFAVELGAGLWVTRALDAAPQTGVTVGWSPRTF